MLLTSGLEALLDQLHLVHRVPEAALVAQDVFRDGVQHLKHQTIRVS